jgi:DNA polymerase/3'-5' exonuclease PolX
MELIKVQKIAIDICYKLHPFCSKINIAGSIRRKKPEVKDIEIICRPKLAPVSNDNLFDSGEPKFDIISEFALAIAELGTIEKGNAKGKYMKIVLPEGINLDLFIPDEEDYYRQYAIRTGSADYSFKVIATGWRKLGWVGSDLGLRLEKDCIETKLPGGKSKWTCVRNKNNKPPVWDSEESFFKWLNVPFVKPEYRNI